MAKYFDIRKLKFRMKKKIRLFLDDVNRNNPQAVINLCGGRDFKFENVWLMANGHVGVIGYTWCRDNNIVGSYMSHIFNHKAMVPDDYGNCATGAPYSIKNSRLFHLWPGAYASHLITGVDKKNNIWYDAICHNNANTTKYYACNIKKVSTTNFNTTAKGQLTHMTAQHYSVIWDAGKNGAKDPYAFNKNPFNWRQGAYISNSIGLSAGDAFNGERTNGVFGFTATPENPVSAAYYTTNSRIIRRCGMTILLELTSKRMRIWRDSDLRKRVTNIHKNYNFGSLYNTVSACNFNHQEWAMNDDRWFMFGVRESHPSHFIMGKLKSVEAMFASGNNNVWEVAPKLIPIRDCLLPEQRTLNPTYYCNLMKDFTDTGLSVFDFNKAAGTVYGAIGIGIVNDNGKCEIRYITANELGITESFVDNLLGDLSEDGKELAVIHNPGNNGPEGESLLWIFDVIYEDDDLTTHETLNGGGGQQMENKNNPLSSISSVNKEEIYENIKDEINGKLGNSSFEIVPSLKEIHDENYYLLDGSVYNKSELPDLYEIFKDNFKTHANREVKEDEFALPNLSGRYLVGRNKEGQGFETSDEALQAFALESEYYFGFKPLDNIIKKYFKSKEIESINQKSDINTERIIKKIIPFVKKSNRMSISIDDKAYFFYIRRK